MACLGVHFSLEADQVAALRAVDEDARVDYVQEEFEERLWSADKGRAEETDKAWDAIHRALTDGSLGWDGGSYPLNRAVLGGELLYGESDYILSLKSPVEVHDVAVALAELTKEKFREGYFQIDEDDCDFKLSDDDFEYTWEWLQGLAAFYKRSAAAGHYVLFTVDQ